MRSMSLGKLMRGSFESSMLGFDAEGGSQGPWTRGSGIMVRGMPFLRKVAGLGVAEPRKRDVGEVGREEEVMGLSVSRLCRRGFLAGVVRASSGRAFVAASKGVRIRPDDSGGSSLRPRSTTLRFFK